MLRKRVITALWGIPLLVVTVWFDQPLPWFTILMTVWGILAILEFCRLVSMSKVMPLTYFGLVWTALLIISREPELLSILEPHFNINLLIPLLFTSAVMFSLIRLLFRAPGERSFTGWAWTMAGILFVGWLLSYLVALRSIDPDRDWVGRNWVFLAFFATFGSDTAAFFIGRAFGRQHLAPSISPSKTWEGAIAGIIGAIIVSLLFILPTPVNLGISWWQAIILGLLVSIFGQLGDLAESLLKRNLGVKDSGKLIPGHGGILDRTDSITFAGVVVYYYVVWLIQ